MSFHHQSFPPPYREEDQKRVEKEEKAGRAMEEAQKKADEEGTHDQFTQAMGHFGLWQGCLFLSLGLALLPGTYPILVMTFMNAKIDFWCSRPPHLSHLSPQVWREISGQDEAGSACQVYDVNFNAFSEEGLRLISENSAVNGSSVVGMRDCVDWEYDDSVFESTVATEWDLVCSREYLLSVAQTAYFLGMTVGVFVVGVLTDRFGRRPALLTVVALVSLFGAATSIVASFEVFLMARFLTALGAIGVLVILMTFLLEIVGGPWSSVMGVGVEYFWAAAWLTLGVMAQYLTSWRHLLLATSLPGLVPVLIVYLVMPESPKWLMTVGRVEEAEAVVRRAAQVNGRKLVQGWRLEQDKEVLGRADRKTPFTEIFKHPQLRRKTLLLYANWFSNAIVYYGLSLNAGSLAGDDLFLNFLVNGAMEIPAYTAAILLLVYCGRRVPYSAALTVSGICLLATLALILLQVPSPGAVAAVATLGKFFVTISFASVYLYSSELYPTELRASGVGSCCFFSRVGGAAASWLALAASSGGVEALPSAVYGVAALACGITALALPETKGRKLPDTIEESEKVPLRTNPATWFSLK